MFLGRFEKQDGRPGQSVKKVAHCTQVHDMWPFGPLVIDMEHDWKKATLKPAVTASNSNATNLTRHFKGGSPSLEGSMTPSNNFFG